MNGRGGYESPYYAGGGGGGGGFMQGGGGGGGPMSQGSAGGAGGSPGGKGARSSSIRPVTLKQLENVDHPHPDADFAIDGVDVGLVSVVAVARNVSRNVTQEIYMLEDGTGGYEARRWFSKDGEGEDEDEIQQDTYVYIIGELKEFNNKRHVSIKNIRRIKDFNEVSYHLLESLSVSLQMRGGGVKRDGGAAMQDYAAGGGGMQSNGLLAQGAAAAGGGGANDQWAAYPAMFRKILEYTQVEGNKTHEGVHVGSVARHVGGDMAEIADAIEQLVSDGALFSTIDDEHVKVV